RRWRALGWGIVSAALVGLASLPVVGLGAWRAYGQLLPDLAARPERAVTAYQTQLGLIRHLLTFDAQWNPSPLFQAPALGTWLPWVAFIAMAGLSVYVALTTDRNDLAFAAFVVAGVVLSPFSLDYHYTLLLLPLAILIAWAREQSSPWPWLVLTAGIVLVGADLPYRSPWLAAGAWALLAYPKLYG